VTPRPEECARFFPLAAVFGYFAIAVMLIIPFGHREIQP
jgi:hypothetical protein